MNAASSLIDEFGGGTEPQIGGAIAEAVLKRFNQKRTFGVITTHYQNLKHFAEDHEGVVNGAMLYDRHLMQALFQLQIGNPGSSFAVEIARKIGLPEDVIADASGDCRQRGISMPTNIFRILSATSVTGKANAKRSASERSIWKRLSHATRRKWKNCRNHGKRLSSRRKKKQSECYRNRMPALKTQSVPSKEAQAEKEKTRLARQELTDFRTSLDALASKEQEEKMARKMEKLKEKQERKKNKKNEPKTAAVSPTSTPKVTPITVGDNVKIKGQTSVGQVMEINGKNATVAFRKHQDNRKTRAARTQQCHSKTEGIAKSTFVSSQTHDQMYEKKLNFKQDIDVRGMRGDEALQAVTYFVDDAILVGMDRVRILHGTGTGILRTLIRQYLSTVPGVRHYADEHVQFGGAGITVVDFD